MVMEGHAAVGFELARLGFTDVVEEGSEAQGYIAEALAYADGDLSSFDEEV